MLRPLLVGVGLVSVGLTAFAQFDARPRLKPITAPLRHAGVYHVATGTWTRGTSLASLVGPDVVYNNTCSPVYFTGMLQCDGAIQHRSRIPSTSGPTTDSQFYGTTNSAHRYDEHPGCEDAYVIQGFEVSYCSSHVGTVGWEYQFASSYTACGASNMVPQYTFTQTLPGGTSTGAQACWVVDFDLSGLPGGGMVLSADGDGTYDGPSTMDQFGFGFRLTTTVSASDFTGPVVAGNYTWTGGPVKGPQTPCTGTDGTIWDSPVDPSEAGTGMASSDFFRVTNNSCQCGECFAGCYSFGGPVHSDFYLELFAGPACPADPLTPICLPGVGGVRACPCSNPPASSSVGCDNFGPSPPGGTGGARLAASGFASVAGDTLKLHVSDEVAIASNLTVLWQGTSVLANGPPSGVQFGAGVRCVGGSLKRLYKGNAASGAIAFPTGAQPSVSTASANRGYTIDPPITLYYFAAYRNSAAGGPCGNAALGYNATNAGSIAWTP